MKGVLGRIVLAIVFFFLALGMQVGLHPDGIKNGIKTGQPPAWSLDAEPMAAISAEISADTATTDLEARGRDFYRSGNYAQAARIWQQMAAQETDELRRAAVLSNLCLCLTKLGRWDEATAAIDRSWQLLDGFDDRSDGDVLRVVAQTLHIRGSLEFERGDLARAGEYWQEATQAYEGIGDRDGAVRSQLDRASALQGLGLYRRAEQILQEVGETLESQPNSPLKVAQLRSLANVLRVLGQYGDLDDLDDRTCRFRADATAEVSTDLTAASALHQSWSVARQMESPQMAATIQFGLGNIVRAIYQREKGLNHPTVAVASARKALACYQQAAAAVEGTIQIRSQLNTLSLGLGLVKWLPTLEEKEESLPFSSSLKVEIERQVEAQLANWPAIEAQIDELPVGRRRIYARTDLARSLMAWGGESSSVALGDVKGDLKSQPRMRRGIALDRSAGAERLLSTAVVRARELGDARAESYTLGYLGQLYEGREKWSAAKAETLKALLLAQSVRAGDIAYQWQWQWGRILKSQTSPDREEAIVAYTEAVKTLQSLRRDLVAISKDVQFDFRDRGRTGVPRVGRFALSAQNPLPGESPPSPRGDRIARTRRTRQLLPRCLRGCCTPSYRSPRPPGGCHLRNYLSRSVGIHRSAARTVRPISLSHHGSPIRTDQNPRRSPAAVATTLCLPGNRTVILPDLPMVDRPDCLPTHRRGNLGIRPRWRVAQYPHGRPLRRRKILNREASHRHRTGFVSRRYSTPGWGVNRINRWFERTPSRF